MATMGALAAAPALNANPVHSERMTNYSPMILCSVLLHLQFYFMISIIATSAFSSVLFHHGDCWPQVTSQSRQAPLHVQNVQLRPMRLRMAVRTALIALWDLMHLSLCQ